MITVSIITHGHGERLASLVGDLLRFAQVSLIIVTVNIPESVSLPVDARLIIVRNPSPKGFGANHNAAFRLARGQFFCPLNPDVRFRDNPFPMLLQELQRPDVGLVVPLVLSEDGRVEDSIRRFPTIRSLLSKLFGRDDGRYRVEPGQAPFHPDWAAGMFMLFKADLFASLGGFDEKFFLYYEDVDICARAWASGAKVLACPAAAVMHDAQRNSRRDLRFMRWHLVSMARYFFKYWLRLPRAMNGCRRMPERKDRLGAGDRFGR